MYKKENIEVNKNIFLPAVALKYSVGYNPVSPSGFLTFSWLITKTFYIVPTKYISVFCRVLRTNSDYLYAVLTDCFL
jgi:hypothetical protein